MDKKTYRQSVRRRMKELSRDYQEKCRREEQVTDRLFLAEEWQKADVVAVTLSMDTEFNTECIIRQALQDGKRVGVPRTFPAGQMDFYAYDSQTKLTRTSFGVLEPETDRLIRPEQIDLLIVPGVVFRDDGYRIGFGGGFYDWYLDRYQGRTISLIFTEQLNNDWQPEEYDRPVQKLLIG